jgi:hypothetical protein
MALGVLAGMAIMGLVSLAFSLYTVSFRRGNDYQDTASETPAVTSRGPREPLGYLPANTNLMAAVHVAQILRESSGRELLHLPGAHQGESFLDQFEKWIGLHSEDLEVLAAGLKVDDRLLPRLVLVCQTNRPIESGYLQKLEHQAQRLERKHKTLYRLAGQGSSLGYTLFHAAPNVLIAALNPEDLDGVPTTPHPGLDHLPEPIQHLLEHRVTPEAHAWIIGHAENWNRTVAGPLLAKWLGETPEQAAGLQSWGISLRFAEAAHLDAAFHCRDEKSSRTLQVNLKAQWTPHLGQEPQLEHGWVLLQGQSRPQLIRELLAQGLTGMVQVSDK